MNSFQPQQNVAADVRKPENGIHIGDLDNGVSEELLYITLKEYGQLKYIKLHRYPFIGVSRHFAFAYFNTEEQANLARQGLNHKKLLKNPLRVTPLKHFDKEANLLFKDFKPDVDLYKVDEFFSKWGSVFSVKFSYDEQGQSRGYGWVQFENLQSATDCLKECKDTGHLTYEQSKIQVDQFVQKAGRDDKKCDIYIKNFAKAVEFDVNDQELLKEYEKEQTEEIKKVFEAYGAIGSVFVTIDKVKKTPYAFVSFIDHESGKKVVEKFSQRNSQENRDIFNNGSSIYVNWAQRKEDRRRNYEGQINDRYVFAQHLRGDLSEDKLREALANFGTIHTTRFDRIHYAFGQSCRIAYIVFENAADAQRLIKQMERFRINPILEETEKAKTEQIAALFEPTLMILTNLFKNTKKKFGSGQRMHSQQPRRSPGRQFQMSVPPQNRFMPPNQMPFGGAPQFGGQPMMFQGPPPQMMGFPPGQQRQPYQNNQFRGQRQGGPGGQYMGNPMMNNPMGMGNQMGMGNPMNMGNQMGMGNPMNMGNPFMGYQPPQAQVQDGQ